MRDDVGRLQDILEAIEKIERYADRGRQAFDGDETFQVWVVYHLQILGEAASKLSPAIRAQYPELPWTQIIGMRNVLVHDYFGIDLDIVWAVVERDLPQLKPRVAAILRDLKG
jgi:uncharacterized protein with HEPN domain